MGCPSQSLFILKHSFLYQSSERERIIHESWGHDAIGVCTRCLSGCERSLGVFLQKADFSAAGRLSLSVSKILCQNHDAVQNSCFKINSMYCRVPPLWGLPFQWREDMWMAFSKWSSHNANEASNLSDLVTQLHTLTIYYWIMPMGGSRQYDPLLVQQIFVMGIYRPLSWYLSFIS